ncbi:SIR2 family NAD-dependent protein deacylase [Paraburkholderia youngii]|uniref:SIR2 family NAD-dependent protein deacylase n=1 Tax=Paraburkholderia youngii TaxID=2782701 RepID=UPI003D24B205
MTETTEPRKPRLYVFSGAGLSAESGLHTFREAGGIWDQYAAGKVGSYRTWAKNREAVFDFNNVFLAQVRAAEPNDAHRVLARWQQAWGADRVVLLTQNADDLLERAGATRVVHLHGDLCSLQCTRCNVRFPAAHDRFDPSVPCPRCQKTDRVKPGIVMFDEGAPNYEHLHSMWFDLTPEDVFLAVGTAFAVIGADWLFPPSRRGAEARNIIVDPRPQLLEHFGAIYPQPATIGLRAVEPLVCSFMDARVHA